MVIKKGIKVFMFSLSVLLCCISCSTGSNPGDDNPSTDLNPENHRATIPTESSLIGSWSKSYTISIADESDYDTDGNTTEIIGTDTKTITYTFNNSGSFTMIDGEVETYIGGVHADTCSYEVKKGSYTVVDGILKLIVTHRLRTLSTPIDLSDSAPWSIFTENFEDSIIAVGTKIYIDNVYKREGSGTGLNGTWSNESANIYSDGSEVMYRFIITISGSTGTSTNYIKEDSKDWAPDSDYNLSLTKTSMRIIGLGEDIPYIFAGDYLTTAKGYELKK